MYRILIHRRGQPEMELGHGLSRDDVIRLFFVLHNAVHVARDPIPLMCPRDSGRTAFVFPQEIRELRLMADGVDVTANTLVGD